MKKERLQLEFSKKFFATFLNVRPEELRYVFLKYEDDEDCIYGPGIRVRGIDHWCFDIETSNFIRLGQHHSMVPAKIMKSRNEVVFKGSNGESFALKKINFYRHYMTKIVNDLLD